MASRRIKLGIVGIGWVALTDYLPALASDALRERVELTAVCDVAAERAREIGARYGAREVWTDLDEMLARTEAEAIALFTPIPLHYRQAIAAIEAGKQLYIQKTMTTTYVEASDLIERARHKGVLLCASPGQMLDPAHRAARELLERGSLGKVSFARGQGSHPGHENVDTYGIDPTWYYRPGGGPVMDVAVYPLHSLTGLMGSVRRVTALSGVAQPSRTYRDQPIDIQMDDSTLMLLDFGDSVFAEVNGTYCQRARNTPQVELYCERGVIQLGGWARPQVPLEVWSTEPAHGLPRGWYQPDRMQPTMRHTVADLAHFADCVADGLAPVHSAAHAAHVIEVIERAYQAARTGQTQAVESTLEG
jgi:predicted dehydrogenase